jgi:hypothetical protein
MDDIMNWILLLLGFMPIPLEIAYDKYRWAEGKEDKPLSTYLRVGVFALIVIALAVMDVSDWWKTLIFLTTTFGVFFDNILNLFRQPRKPLFYHPAKKKKGIFNMATYYWETGWNMIANGVHWSMEVFIKFIIYWTGWMVMFHWDWICCSAYPSDLIDYFKF